MEKKIEEASKNSTEMTERIHTTKPEKVLYTAGTHTSGGREGMARSSDGRLDIQLASPGSTRVGTNPEQLFAAGWSASIRPRPPVPCLEAPEHFPDSTALLPQEGILPPN
jgi:hypothetical protein